MGGYITNSNQRGAFHTVPPTYGRVYRRRRQAGQISSGSAPLWAGISLPFASCTRTVVFRPLMGGYIGFHGFYTVLLSVPPTYWWVYRLVFDRILFFLRSAHLWAGIKFWFSCCTQKYIKQIRLSSMDGETAARLAVIVWRKYSDIALHSDFVVV